MYDLLVKSRKAQEEYEKNGSQEKYDRAAKAAAWAILKPENNLMLASLAVEQTGLGNVEDKVTKNFRKTLGLMRDLEGVKTFGIVNKFPDLGIIEVARPKGVIASIVPSTNPAATPANNIINALKCGNSVIVSPSPKGSFIAEKLISLIRQELSKIGELEDLVQVVPRPINMAKTEQLFKQCDFSIVTGAQVNVRKAYSSGMPVIGVGTGNVTTIIDETANLKIAAELICASKSFDNGTSCSSESNILVLNEVYEDFRHSFISAGALILGHDKAKYVIDAMWKNGDLNPDLIAKTCDEILTASGLFDEVGKNYKIIALETEIHDDIPTILKEKLSVITTMTKVPNFQSALDYTKKIYSVQGAGHSVGLHSSDEKRMLACSIELPTSRVIVNQAHSFGTGGAFNNGLPFSLSMGCGSWGKNSISENLNYSHFMQITRISQPIEAAREPSIEELFPDYV